MDTGVDRKLKVWMAQESPEIADRYREARKATVIAEAKTRVREELGRPWRRTFGWPQESFSKPFGVSGNESRA